MAKLNDIGLGKYIRNPRRSKGVLKIETDTGNGFICYPVKEIHSTRVVLDLTKYQQLAKDFNAEEVTI